MFKGLGAGRELAYSENAPLGRDGKAQDKSSERWARTFSADSGRQVASTWLQVAPPGFHGLQEGGEMEENAQVTPVTFIHYALSRIQSYGHT